MIEIGQRRHARAFAGFDQVGRELSGVADASQVLAAGCAGRLILSGKRQLSDSPVKMLYRSRDAVLSPSLGAVLRLVACHQAASSNVVAGRF